MLESFVSNSEWARCEDVPILITPPQEEYLTLGEDSLLTSTYHPHADFDLGRPMLDQSLPNSSLTSLSFGKFRSVPNLHFDLSDSECELSGYGSLVPSPIPSPLGDTFGFEDDFTSFPIPSRRDSFTYSDTSELHEEVNGLFIQDLPFTNFSNFSTDTLSPPPSNYTGRSRSASMTIPRTQPQPDNSYPSTSPYGNFNLDNRSFTDLPSTAQVLLRSRASSMSSLPLNNSIVPPPPPNNYDIYNMIPIDGYPEGYSPIASPPLDQFHTSVNGSVESLPNLSSSYSSYQSYGHPYDSNGSSTEYLSLEDTVQVSDYYHHPGTLSYNISDISSHPYSMKGKRGRSHTCHFCQRPFTRKHDLHRHIRVHTGDKPYKCEFCGKTFARTDALKRHFRVDEECGKAHEVSNLGKGDMDSVVKDSLTQ